MIDTLDHRSGVQFQTDADVHSYGIEVTRDGNPNNRSVTPTGALAVFPAVDVEFCTLNGVKYQLEAVPRYFQWVAVAPKGGPRPQGFLPRQGLTPGIDSSFSIGRERRQGCVKELRNRIKPKISWGHASKIRRPRIAAEVVVPTFQTSGLAGLQGNGNPRLLGATGRRGQPTSMVNSLKTARNQN